MESPTTARVNFREMTNADLDEVLKNETRAYVYPWSRGIFSDCIAQAYDCRVMTRSGAICGHAVLSAAAGEAHLLNVCVQREQQGQGLGRRFVEYLIARAATLGAQMFYLEVRPSNRVAIALYDSLGFVQIGERKDYYPSADGREDALVMALTIGEETLP